MIDKKKIVEVLVSKLQNELSEIEAAAKSAKDLATGPESKSEGKYDTRAIEAGYLAGAQAKRVEEIKLDIQMLEELDISTIANKLQLGTLGLIEYNQQERLYFISSTSGGSILNIDGQSVLVISVFSPIGDSALGHGKGDIFEVETPKEVREYKILNIF